MKFTTILSALALGAFSQLASAAPAPAAHQARDVWDPLMTYPTAETVWQSGQTYTVTWETEDAPVNITNGDGGFIILRSGDEETSVLLAWDIHLRDGQAQVTAPNVITGNFSLVLFGDSGNWGPNFLINGPVTF
ncbi:uncharacterized protein PHACADRAFT_255301 [Phanerochaete carnosa HHB-10118-sp]|uniref:Uncharacterized protein n=1 Tax=Phanerochaete carnosa (strain HHB-10118-sp) TaxID=650164 RepID=K5W766_PHACS|nr:uncharacterized protein PHACADRAFT_255301 [Phanerochaete carnosa HHB-10118-sp]EKM55010.1 hypothetical protein PHACADRAFT_255301 [Phanerochaete carnosa HHB-10118-sp]